MSQGRNDAFRGSQNTAARPVVIRPCAESYDAAGEKAQASVVRVRNSVQSVQLPPISARLRMRRHEKPTCQ